METPREECPRSAMLTSLRIDLTDTKKIFTSLHGLIRGENMDFGRGSDIGGHVQYVVEFARTLGSMPRVYRVDLC
ncbi:unnamed protein product [Brassica oleracea var. botrytis]